MTITPTYTYANQKSNREFLPGRVRDLPVYLFRIYFTIKSGSPFFFSNVNPGFFFSGFVELDKHEQLKDLDRHLLPKMFVAHTGDSIETIENNLKTYSISYPFIAKPNVVGRNGTNVKRIDDQEELVAYRLGFGKDILIQEFLDYPLEFGVYYYRMPSEADGHVTGIVGKDFLFVEGDGIHTLKELVSSHLRARHYTEMIQATHPQKRESVIPRGEIIQLNYIGNHCKGSIFYDQSALVTPELEKLFDAISKKVPGFFCGRYDLKAQSIEDLYAGNFKILELNGVISEPTRIYDPSRSFRKANEVMFYHRKLMYLISKENRRLGHPYLSIKEARKIIKKYGM